MDTGGEGAPGRGKDEEDEADIEGAFAAVAVGSGAVKELAQGEAEEVSREAPFDLGEGCPKFPCNGGETGEIHVDGQGPKPGKSPEEDRQGEDESAGEFWAERDGLGE